MITPDQIEFEEKERVPSHLAPPKGSRRFNLSPQVFNALLLLIPAILLSTTGELFFKRGMTQIGEFEFSFGNIAPVLLKIALNPNIWVGGVGFIGGSVFWLFVLSRAPLSLAYPILALSYFVIVFESWLFFGERVTWVRVLGVGIIIVGVVLVGLSEGSKE
jgi:drug/metabolite transporter (DMT)-like permease